MLAMDWSAFGDYLYKVISTPFVQFDRWDVVGFVGQLLFFSRFLVQWIASERKKRNVIPVAFWYLSIAGAFISLLYFVHLGKLPLIAAGGLSMLIYGRNLRIWFKRRIQRRGLTFASATAQTGLLMDEDDAPE